ncbi:hypothetical protein ACJX0J_027575, partial [Zea mays]
VRPKMFMAFAMQPLLAQVSYAGADGHAFAFYRTEHGEARALFTDSQKRWCTQAVDPATGRLVGSAAVAASKDAALVASKNASPASLRAGWARPDVRMLFFSAPVGDAAGVVSAAIAVHDVFEAAAARIGVQDGLNVYYAVGDKVASAATTNYKPLSLGYQYGTAEDTAEEKLSFSRLTCAASAIDDATPELGQLVPGGPKYRRYKAACTTFDVSGVQVALRLVLRPSIQGHMLQALCVSVVFLACVLVLAAAVSCALAVRALRWAAAREMALNVDLARQKEALRQAEFKSNAFASASHDIRSALSAIAGLVDMSRPEVQSVPGIMENLDQMGVCTNKLFDILNSVLDTSKVGAGKMQLEEAEFTMADVLQESVDMANVTGVQRGVEVVWDPCDFSVLRCTAVIGDSKRLKQILDNLLGNALKFTDEGHVVLRCWATRPIVGSNVRAPSRFMHPRHASGGSFGCFFRAQEDPSHQDHLQNDPNLVEFYFEVVDTGIGIPKENRMSVFENYVQVNNGQGGTGLGLGIVQSFVRLMGGEISIKDKEPGERGTCFAFNVLLKISEMQQPQDIEEGPSVPSGTLNLASAFQEANNFKGVHCILYVRGYETRRIMQTWMESIGVKVWLVPQAKFIGSTLEKVRSNSTTIIAMDYNNADRCFSFKEKVNQLRNNTGIRRVSLGGIPSGILIVIDVSGGETEEIFQEMAKLARIKHQAPCKVVLLKDIKTPSNDLRKLKDLGCDLVLRKPVHGSRLFTLLMTLRDLQVSNAQAQSSHVVGPGIAGNSQQHGLPDVVVPCVQETNASTELASCLAQEQKPEDDKPLSGMQILLAEDTLVLQTIQKKVLNQLGALVTVAQNGAVAVNLLREALEQANASKEDIVSLPYHVILMDCQ